MNCAELYAKVDRATIPLIKMQRLRPIAIYLGDIEYRSILNDRAFRDYGTMPKNGEPWQFVGVPMYNVRLTSHCFIAVTQTVT